MAFSFLKRRLGLQRGQSLPLVDQYDFLLGAFLLTALTSYGWLTATFDLMTLIVVIIMTPILHLGTNIIGYWIGVKNEPW